MKKIITHSGTFHADDVFAVATIILSLPEGEEYEIIRTRDNSVVEKGDYVVDVGRVYEPAQNRFDHHQEGGAGKRENGIPYASFGLVWKEFGEKISGSKEVAEKIEEKLAMYIDAIDNGVMIDTPTYKNVRAYTISDYLYSFWVDEDVTEEGLDKIFIRVASMAKDLIKREIFKIETIIREEKLVLDIYNKTEDKRIIILDKHLPWGNVLANKPEPLIVVFPGIDSNKLWRAKAVRVVPDKFDSRIKFPKEWAGKVDKELAEISGVSDAVFCHIGRFIVVAKSKEGAISLAKLTIG